MDELIKFPENKIANNSLFLNDIFLENVSSLYKYSFANNQQLSNIYIHKDITNIGENAFVYSERPELYINQKREISPLLSQSFTWGLDTERIHFLETEDQIFYNTLDGNSYYYRYNHDKKSITITGATSPDITDIKLPPTINNIPITNIGTNAFTNYSRLSNVELPNGIKVLENECFGYSGLSSIVLPSTLTDINDYALANCSNLRNVYLSGMRETYNDLSNHFTASANNNGTIGGSGYNNLFRGDMKVSACYVNCALSNIFDTGFYNSPISAIQFCWDDNDTTKYQISAFSDISDDTRKNTPYLIFGNDNYKIIIDDGVRTTNTTNITDISGINDYDYLLGSHNTNCIFELKKNAENNDSDDTEWKFNNNVRLFFAYSLDATASEAYGPSGSGYSQHNVAMIPCFIASFFGNFTGFGKYAFFNLNLSYTTNSGSLRNCLGVIDNNDAYLSTIPNLSAAFKMNNPPDKLSCMYLDKNFFNNMSCFGSEFFESKTGCTLIVFNSLLNNGNEYDKNGLDFDPNSVPGQYDDSGEWFNYWGNINITPHFKQNAIAGELGNGAGHSFDILYGQKYFLNAISNDTTNFGDFVWCGPNSRFWPNLENVAANMQCLVIFDNQTIDQISAEYIETQTDEGKRKVTINSKDLSALGNYAFSGNNGISCLVFKPADDEESISNITAFKESVFRSMSALTYIEGLSYLTNLDTILSACFLHTPNLLSLNLGNSKITEIKAATFRQCYNLSSLYLPSTLTDIENGTAFAEMSSLSNIQFGNADGPISSLSNGNGTFIVDKRGESQHSYLLSVFNDNTDSDTSAVIITMLQASSSSDYINFNDSQVDVTDYGFYMNPTVASLSAYSENIFGYRAFSNISNLSSIKLFENSTIGLECFYGLPNLSSLTIEDNISVINSYRQYKRDLSAISAFEHLLDVFNRDSFSNLVTLDLSSNGNIKYIPAYMCTNNTNLTAAYLPRNTKYIADHAFANCTSLLSTNISNLSSLISIDDYAFLNCTSLPTELSIPDGTINIGKHSFEGCSNILSIYIPASVKLIDVDAFANCSSLNTIKIDQKQSESSIDIDNIGILFTDDISSTTTNSVSCIWNPEMLNN